MSKSLKDQVESITFFDQCWQDEAFVTEIIKVLRPKEVSASTVIFPANEEVDEMILMQEGKVVMGDYVLTPGQSFGELATVFPQTRDEDVVAAEDSKILLLGKAELKAVLGKFPAHVDGVRSIAEKRYAMLNGGQEKKADF